MLVPFIDMMTILVVFLLLHTADVDVLPNTKNISIPQSISDIKPRETVVVMVTRDSIYVDGQLVGTVAEVAATDGQRHRAAEGSAAQPERPRARRCGGQCDSEPRSDHHGRSHGAL